MDDAPSRPSPRAGGAAAALAAAVGVLSLAGLVLATQQTDQDGYAANLVALVAAGGGFGPIGALIVRRRGNAVGWAMLGVAVCLAVQGFGTQYAIVAATGAVRLPAASWVLVAGLIVLAVTPGPAATLFLLFPSGRLPGRRWRPVLWVNLVSWPVISGLAVTAPGDMTLTESSQVRYPNPIAVPAVQGVVRVLLPVVIVVGLAAALISIGSLVARFRHAGAADRRRITGLAWLGVLLLAFLPVEYGLAGLGAGESTSELIFYLFYGAVALGTPVAIGVAILRHGLYEIDIVIRKTVVVAVLSAFFVAVYALVVGGVGALLEGVSSTALSFVAAALVAVLSQPALARARRFADVVVYGRRATPYEVLAEFSGMVAETRSHEAVLDEMARAVGEGAGAVRAAVWVRLDRSLHETAAWPTGPASAPVPLAGPDPPAAGDLGAEVAAPVRYEDDLLGILTLSMPPSDPATEATRRLVTDLAGQAGLVLRNVQLIEDLRASRRRLVTAQDEERRRLERNLHDGAQQELIALRLRLRMAEAVRDDPGLMLETLQQLGDAAQSALDNLRDLARGIYPPLLADRGLAAALAAQASKSSVDVRVQADGIGRFGQDTEAAVYFCSLEALQNVAKYAGATSAVLRLQQDDGVLAFSLSDDGAGFDTGQVGYGTGLQGMADRLAALGGSLSISSQPGAGTTVTGRIPVGAAVTAPAGGPGEPDGRVSGSGPDGCRAASRPAAR